LNDQTVWECVQMEQTLCQAFMEGFKHWLAENPLILLDTLHNSQAGSCLQTCESRRRKSFGNSHNIVNHIKKPVKARLFPRLWEEVGAEHSSLIFYCESRWLSCRSILLWAIKLRDELHQYLREVNYNSAYMFSNSDFIIKLAYLNNILINWSPLTRFCMAVVVIFFSSVTNWNHLIKKLNSGREN
jgi:hypothetical protein